MISSIVEKITETVTGGNSTTKETVTHNGSDICHHNRDGKHIIDSKNSKNDGIFDSSNDDNDNKKNEGGWFGGSSKHEIFESHNGADIDHHNIGGLFINGKDFSKKEDKKGGGWHNGGSAEDGKDQSHKGKNADHDNVGGIHIYTSEKDDENKKDKEKAGGHHYNLRNKD